MVNSVCDYLYPTVKLVFPQYNVHLSNFKVQQVSEKIHREIEEKMLRGNFRK